MSSILDIIPNKEEKNKGRDPSPEEARRMERDMKRRLQMEARKNNPEAEADRRFGMEHTKEEVAKRKLERKLEKKRKEKDPRVVGE